MQTTLAIFPPSSFEVRPARRSSRAKGSSPAEIHRELCPVYCPSLITEGRLDNDVVISTINDPGNCRPA